MEKLAFVASCGAMVPSIVLLQLSDRNIVRASPLACNFVLDATPFPRADEIHAHLDCMGAMGRTLYADFHLFDLVLFPLIYGTNLAGLLRRVWPCTPYLWLFPLGAALADVAENACISFLLAQFPTRLEQAEIAVSWCTPIKWGLATLAVVLAILGVVRMAIAWAKGTKQSIRHDKAA